MSKSHKNFSHFSNVIKHLGERATQLYYYSYSLKQRTDVAQGLYKPVPMNK